MFVRNYFFNKKQKTEYESLRNKINKCGIKVQNVIANIEKLKHIYKNTFIPNKEFSDYLNRFLQVKG
jgi:L-rhamnose isomerase